MQARQVSWFWFVAGPSCKQAGQKHLELHHFNFEHLEHLEHSKFVWFIGCSFEATMPLQNLKAFLTITFDRTHAPDSMQTNRENSEIKSLLEMEAFHRESYVLNDAYHHCARKAAFSTD